MPAAQFAEGGRDLLGGNGERRAEIFIAQAPQGDGGAEGVEGGKGVAFFQRGRGRVHGGFDGGRDEVRLGQIVEVVAADDGAEAVGDDDQGGLGSGRGG